MSQLNRLLREDGGATAVEYGLVVSLVAVTLVIILQALGLNLTALFEGIADDIAIAVFG
jgi:pilus assembly protein Flp/PilA